MKFTKNVKNDMFFEVISWLNDHDLVGTSHVFNCKEIGILEVWWDSKWEHRWLKIEELPEEIKNEISMKVEVEILENRPTTEGVVVRIGNTLFRCDCGCNVFHHPEEDPKKFQCNTCKVLYEGE